ncbi:MAG: hypothetical protein WBB82_17000 [Limnothrix sp.]
MPRGKITAIITGAISLLVAIAYLVLVQVLDFRGEMIPAPISQTVGQQQAIAVTPINHHQMF